MSAGLTYTNSFSNEKPNGNVFYSPINSVNNIYDITQRDAAGNLLGVEPTRINPPTVIETFDFTQATSRTINDVQFNLTPFISTVSAASSTTVTAGYGLDRFAVSGQFVQATLGYKNGLFLTAALRRDGSTLFSPSQTNQLNPKVSASWVVSDFLKNSLFSPDAVSNLKLRASFGDAGGVSALGTYDGFWQFNPTAYLGMGTIVPSGRLANPNVRPERMRELEGGLDLGLLNDRIGLTITGYSQPITNLVVSRTLAEGGTSITNNVGEMTTKGLEIGLNRTPVKTKDFEWDVTLIYNRNKVVSLGWWLYSS